MKLSEYTPAGFKFKRQAGVFGIEIETEVKSLESYPGGADFLNPEYGSFHYVPQLDGEIKHYNLWDGVWKGVVDGSLRNFGVEYVLKKPLSYKESLKAVDDFCDHTKEVSFIQNAPGTSVHVHVNMQDEEVVTIASFITTWMFLENVLVEYCGENRRSNLFALPTRCADQMVSYYTEVFRQFLQEKHSAFTWSEDIVKYSALNIAPLSKFGSVEVRTMRGTTDREVLKEWLYVLNSILEFSRHKKPSDVLRIYNLGGYRHLLSSIFPNQEFLSSIDNLEHRIEERLSDTYRFVRSSDWDQVRDKKIEVPEVLQKTPEQILHEFVTLGTVPTIQDNGIFSYAAEEEEDSYDEY